jgi:hypothetical protein
MAGNTAKDLDWALQDSGTVMLTIVQTSNFPESKPRQGEEPRPVHQSYFLYLGQPLTGVPMLDLLLLEVLQDPIRNAGYKLDAVQCALITQSLWLSVLSWPRCW